MKKLIYLLSISFMSIVSLETQVHASELVWTSHEFWQEAVVPCLDELREDILPHSINFDWILFKVFFKKHFMENKEYPHDDQVLKHLLDRWDELRQAESAH